MDDDSGARPSIFESLLREHESERPQRVADRSVGGDPLPSRNPPGWRAADFVGGGNGFVPLADAARMFGLSERETVDACARGLLEADTR